MNTFLVLKEAYESGKLLAENLGTGALNTKFYTSDNYTVAVSKVYKNDIEVSSSLYTTTQLYDLERPALITFNTAPNAEDEITADYIHGNNQIVEGQQIGTGALVSEFETANVAVGFIDAVYIDGTLLIEDVDYSTEELSNKDLPAKIVFVFGIGIEI